MVLTITQWAKIRGVRIVAGFKRWCETRGKLDKERREVLDWDELYREYRQTPIG